MDVLLFWVIGLYIMYLIIKAAVDHSRAAADLQEIRKILEDLKYGDSN